MMFPEFELIFAPRIRTIKDISLDSLWQDGIDDSIWRVTFKDDRIHIVNVASSVLRVCGVNFFFATYSVVEYGATCILCKKRYEFTESKVGFKCWGCANGA
jgi:hypothetical protein